MRSARLTPLAIAAVALLALSCSHAPPPSSPGGPTTSNPPSTPESPGSTAPGSLPGTGTEGTQAPPPPSGPPPTSPRASSSPVSDYHEILKLYQANLSEDFIIQQIRQERRAYYLTADDVITLRNSGVSERVIQAMLDSGKTAVGEPVRDDVITARPEPRPRHDETRSRHERLPSAGTTRGDDFGLPPGPGIQWAGLARRQDGVVIFKDRWHVGTLALAEGQLRWIDAKDSTRNLLIPVNAITEQFVSCLKRPGGNECFEWGIRTSSGETYRFRDVAWQQGINSRPLAVHDEFRSRFPNLVDSEKDVDEKEK